MQAGGSCSVSKTRYAIQQAGGSCCVAKAASYVKVDFRDDNLDGVVEEAKQQSKCFAERPESMVASWSRNETRRFNIKQLRYSKGVYNWRRAPPTVRRAMKKLVQCANVSADIPLVGRSTINVQRELRQKLAQSLAAGRCDAAFAKDCGHTDLPRVDELEKLMSAFPNKEDVDWDAPAVESGLNIAQWKAGHALHCKKCSSSAVSDECYFRLLCHWLKCGFDPPVKKGCDVSTAAAAKRAYVDLWYRERARCEVAFAKWKKDAANLMSAQTDERPHLFFPLLPVVREKDKWRRDKYGTDYKIRLCLDLKQGGYNDMLEDWNFRFWGLDCVGENVKQGDWLASVDISRFYLRLPAGARLRQAQWFQDPESYACNTHDNERCRQNKLRFRQLLSVAFGLKSAPAYASAVSMEAVRILRAHGVDVVGVYIDDILIRGSTLAECAASLRKACAILRDLGIPTNDKVQGPCSPEEGIVFLGMRIRSSDCSITVTDEYRAYAVDRIFDVVHAGKASLKQLESIAGIVTWVSYAFIPGKPRRNVLYRTIAALKDTGLASAQPLNGPLKQQLQWWLSALRSKVQASSFFWCRQPNTPLMVSDASGDDGWGVCVMGLHIVGPWPVEWRQSSSSTDKPSMLWKELVGPVVAILLLARWAPNTVFAAAGDNAGGAFVLNTLSSGCPRVLELLRPLTDAMERYHLGILGGHAHRARNVHADILSHALSAITWRGVIAQEWVRKAARLELPFVVADTTTGEAFAATISFKRPFGPDVKRAAR